MPPIFFLFLFLDTYHLSKSSLRCRALWIVNKFVFFFLWSIRWRSSLVNFNKNPEYIAKCPVQGFNLLMSFLPKSLVSRSFLVRLRYSFFISFFLSFIFTYSMVSASIIPKYLWISFSPSFLIFSWFDRSISSVIWFLLLLIIIVPHFFSVLLLLLKIFTSNFGFLESFTSSLLKTKSKGN